MSIRAKLRERRLGRRQRTFVYCPMCKNELCWNGHHLGQEANGWETYRCSVCGTFSTWDFDTPAPILMVHGAWSSGRFGGDPSVTDQGAEARKGGGS